MIKRLTGLFFFALILMILGCARPHVMLDRAIVLNATENKITDVKVYHQPTRKSGGVNAILPQMTLDIAFSGKPMLANKATISWTDGAGIDRIVTLNLPYDHTVAKGSRLMNLIYIIHSSGTVTAHLEESISLSN